MDTVLEVLTKIAEGTVSFGAIIKAIIAGLGGFYVGKKLPPKE